LYNADCSFSVETAIRLNPRFISCGANGITNVSVAGVAEMGPRNLI